MKKFLLFLLFVVVVTGLFSLFVYAVSHSNDTVLTIEESAQNTFKRHNVYKSGTDSNYMSVTKETDVIRCTVTSIGKSMCYTYGLGELLIKADSDKDSMVTFVELKKEIQKADLNHDGMIDEEEHGLYMDAYNIPHSTGDFAINRLPYPIDYDPVW